MEEKKKDFLEEGESAENQEISESAESVTDESVFEEAAEGLMEKAEEDVPTEDNSEEENTNTEAPAEEEATIIEESATEEAPAEDIEDVNNEAAEEESSEAETTTDHESIEEEKYKAPAEKAADEISEAKQEMKAPESVPQKPIPKTALIIGAAAAAAAVAISLILIFVVFKHKHTWTEQTCTEGVYCTECGEIQLESGYGHSYGEWTITSGATCEGTGTSARTCSKCSDVETRTDNALGHSYGEWTITSEATCTANGSKYRVCSTCNNNETVEIESIGHDMDDATCTAPKTCKNGCGHTEGEALGHEENEGYCDRCGEKIMHPIAEALEKIQTSKNYQVTMTMFDIPFLGTIRIVIKEDGNISYTSESFMMAETYTERVGDDVYKYTKDSSGTWIKEKLEAQDDGNEDDVSSPTGMNFADIFNPDIYNQVGEGRYEQKADVQLTDFENVVTVITDESIVITMGVISGGIIYSFKIVFSNFGNIELVLPEV